MTIHDILHNAGIILVALAVIILSHASATTTRSLTRIAERVAKLEARDGR